MQVKKEWDAAFKNVLAFGEEPFSRLDDGSYSRSQSMIQTFACMQAILGKKKDQADAAKKLAEAEKNLKAAKVPLHPKVRDMLIESGFTDYVST